MPLESDPNATPLKRIMKAVQVHITKVSENTPNVCISPCFTGCDTSAVAATLGADPSPASLLNKPLFIPFIIAAPIMPPKAWFQPKALETISSNTAGICLKFIPITTKAKIMYPTAITGTIIELTFAILCIPPKITRKVRTVSTMPIIRGSKLNASWKAAQIVLLCTELNENGKVKISRTAKREPIQGFLRPFFI